jgi:hypothetical protein
MRVDRKREERLRRAERLETRALLAMPTALSRALGLAAFRPAGAVPPLNPRAFGHTGPREYSRTRSHRRA